MLSSFQTIKLGHGYREDIVNIKWIPGADLGFLNRMHKNCTLQLQFQVVPQNQSNQSVRMYKSQGL